jgi:hypothetical protein
MRQRSQRQKTCRYEEDANGQHRASAQPHWTLPVTQPAETRYPQTLAHRAAHPVQPRG